MKPEDEAAARRFLRWMDDRYHEKWDANDATRFSHDRSRRHRSPMLQLRAVLKEEAKKLPKEDRERWIALEWKRRTRNARPRGIETHEIERLLMGEGPRRAFVACSLVPGMNAWNELVLYREDLRHVLAQEMEWLADNDKRIARNHKRRKPKNRPRWEE